MKQIDVDSINAHYQRQDKLHKAQKRAAVVLIAISFSILFLMLLIMVTS